MGQLQLGWVIRDLSNEEPGVGEVPPWSLAFWLLKLPLPDSTRILMKEACFVDWLHQRGRRSLFACELIENISAKDPPLANELLGFAAALVEANAASEWPALARCPYIAPCLTRLLEWPGLHPQLGVFLGPRVGRRATPSKPLLTDTIDADAAQAAELALPALMTAPGLVAVAVEARAAALGTWLAQLGRLRMAGRAAEGRELTSLVEFVRGDLGGGAGIARREPTRLQLLLRAAGKANRLGARALLEGLATEVAMSDRSAFEILVAQHVDGSTREAGTRVLAAAWRGQASPAGRFVGWAVMSTETNDLIALLGSALELLASLADEAPVTEMLNETMIFCSEEFLAEIGGGIESSGFGRGFAAAFARAAPSLRSDSVWNCLSLAEWLDLAGQPLDAAALGVFCASQPPLTAAVSVKIIKMARLVQRGRSEVR